MRLSHAAPVVVAAAVAGAALAGGGRERPPGGATAPPAPVASRPSPPAPAPPAAPTPTEAGAFATARQRSIATVARQVPLSAYGGHVAWSVRGRGGWWLVQWHGGRVTRIGVAPRSRPFDVDLGPDDHGRPTAVYSRCRPLCRIYRVALDGGGERALGALSAGRPASESHPSIWRGRLAFVARRPGARTPAIYVAGTGATRPVAVRGGTRPRCAGQGGARRARVTGLDLGARVLAFVWEIDSSDVHNGIGPVWEVRLHRVVAPSVVPRDVVVGEGYVSGSCGSVVPES